MRRAFTAVALLVALTVPQTVHAGELDEIAESVNKLSARIILARPTASSDVLARQIWSTLERDAARSQWSQVRELASPERSVEQRRHRFLNQLARGGYVADVSISPQSSALLVAHDGQVVISPAVAGAVEVLFGTRDVTKHAPYVVTSESKSWTPGWVYYGVPVVRPASLAGMFNVLDPACAMTCQQRLDVVVANEIANALLYSTEGGRTTPALTQALTAATDGVRFDSRDEAHEFVSDAASVLAHSCGWTIVLTHLVFATLSTEYDSHAASAMFLLREIEREEALLSVSEGGGARAGLLRARSMQDPDARRREIDAVIEQAGRVLKTRGFTKRVQAAYRVAAHDILRALR